MDYNRTGRKLGIGMRVLGRIANQRLDAAATGKPMQQARAAVPAKAAKLKEGGRRFGAGFFGPLRRAGHSLFLEIAGLFFVLFSVWFLQSAFRLRSYARAGSEHSHFLAYLLFGTVFLYFGITSFVRARRKRR